MKRIKTGDTVKIIAGSLKGQTGKVNKVNGEQVYLENVKTVERHYRATAHNGAAKRNIQLPIHISNVALLSEDKPTKVAYKVAKNGKTRVAKINNREVK